MGELCFGHRTALQIVRGVSPDRLSGLTARQRFLSPRTIARREIEHELERFTSSASGCALDKPVHLVFGEAGRPRPFPGISAHSMTSKIPAGALMRVDGGHLVSTPEFAFLQIAAMPVSQIVLAKLAYELCGCYKTAWTSSTHEYQVEPATTVRALRDFARRNADITGAKKAMRALRYVEDGAESPREADLALLLGLPLCKGGCGTGIPKMNYRVEANALAAAAASRASLRCDLCWPAAKIDVEYQSREIHSNEKSRIEDSRRTNALESMGWRVIGVTNEEIDSLSAMDAVARTVRALLGKRQCIRTRDYRSKQIRLRNELGLKANC